MPRYRNLNLERLWWKGFAGKRAKGETTAKTALKATRVPRAKKVSKATRVPRAKKVSKATRVPRAKKVSKATRVPRAKKVSKATRVPRAKKEKKEKKAIKVTQVLLVETSNKTALQNRPPGQGPW